MYIIRNQDGEFVSQTGVFVSTINKAEVFATYEKAREKVDILKAISEDFYVGIYVDDFDKYQDKY